MTIKKTPIIVTALLLSLAVPTIAFAGPYGHRGYGPGSGAGYERPALAPEKQEACRKIMDSHWDKAAPLRKELSQKRDELEYLSRLPQTEPKTVTGLLGDIQVICDKLDKLNEETAKRIEKEVGIDARGFGMGRHAGYGWHGNYDGPRHMGGRHHMGRW
ncbi:periplasmic heavy metal sensor [Desulfovibrio sp. OttesenSCG-928-C06]|nr:periplasmic heavy metal sensor [Desulfovibrio sp. OttesenSCG-928-C06]